MTWDQRIDAICTRFRLLVEAYQKSLYVQMREGTGRDSLGDILTDVQRIGIMNQLERSVLS